jgi:hypothetical protein
MSTKFTFIPSSLSTASQLGRAVARAHGDAQSDGTLVPVYPGASQGIYRFSAQSRFKFTGRARKAWVTVYNDITDGLPGPANVSGAFVPARDHGMPDGNPRDLASHRVDYGWQTVEIYLPGATQSAGRLVEIVQGLMASPGLLATPQSIWLHSVEFDAPMTPVDPPTSGTHELDVGDSITASGSNAINPLMGLAGLRKRTVAEGGVNGLTSVLGYGFYALYNIWGDSTRRAAFVAKLQSLSPALTRVNIYAGTNDYLVNGTAASIGAYVSAGIASVRAAGGALATLPFTFYLPMMTYSPNSREGVFFGHTLQEIRDAIETAATGLPNVTVVDWGDPAFFTQSDSVDGLHPCTEFFPVMRAAQ